MPILALRNAVLFPGTVMPLVVGRDKTMSLLSAVRGTDRLVGILAQKDKTVDDPGPDDLYRVGTLARIIKTLSEVGHGHHIVVQGLQRFRIKTFLQHEPYIVADVELIPDIDEHDAESEALGRSLREVATEMIGLLPEIPPGASEVVERTSPPSRLAYLVLSNLAVPVEEKMHVLEAAGAHEVLRRSLEIVQHQLEILKVSQRINTEVKGELYKTQREYVLRKQMDAIKRELGEMGVDEEDALEELKKRLDAVGLSEEAKKVADKELKRLHTIQPSSPEYTVARTYLEWLADLPWSAASDDNLDIAHARSILDERHTGLEKIKKRILEYLAVRKLKSDMRGPILCLVGPPGVGKTSLGQAIADALGRKFTRMSLGGVRDEAEIRGHRRTYIGALPGKIIQNLKKAETRNPVFILDEVDKLGRDWRGDPTSALLEVLDPEQNGTFVDHYLDVQFDLSKVMFIATANVTDTIPPPLLDRMDVLELPGYTHDEKLQIAREHLIPKQLAEHGIDASNLTLLDEGLDTIVNRYTREAGVRNLERRIADICRAVAVKVVEEDKRHHRVGPAELKGFLGPEKFERDVAEELEVPGVATGLAWNAAGGDILFIEASRMPGKGEMRITGQLGDVMKESCEIARSYVRSHASEYGIQKEVFERSDLHIHVPAGATPKDGPSAGITIFTALVSLLSGIPIRHDTAMTGEITLRGRVLPVGGIKDKVLAAQRSGITRVILPERNRKDLPDIPESVRESLDIVFVTRMDEALAHALVNVESMPERLHFGGGQATLV